MDKNKNSAEGLIQDRQWRADGVIVRAPLTIRVDGSPSAQVLASQLEVSTDLGALTLRAIARQPRFPHGC